MHRNYNINKLLTVDGCARLESLERKKKINERKIQCVRLQYTYYTEPCVLKMRSYCHHRVCGGHTY